MGHDGELDFKKEQKGGLGSRRSGDCAAGSEREQEVACGTAELHGFGSGLALESVF